MKHGKDSGYMPGHHSKGVRNARWKGGRFMSANGYVYTQCPDHPNALKKGYVGYIAEHRYVMSEHLGRPLETHEIVHHLNGDKADNRIENLVVVSRAKHAGIHTRGEGNGNWHGGRVPIVCQTCGKEFLPKDRRNDYGAKYCSNQCFYDRHN